MAGGGNSVSAPAGRFKLCTEVAHMPVRPRFALGYTVIKPKALKMLTPEEVIAALGSHVVGEWGEVGPTVFEANEEAVENDEPVVSAYRSPSTDTRFYVMTSADRSVTTVFLTDEAQL
jgi:hypothetical protein